MIPHPAPNSHTYMFVELLVTASAVSHMHFILKDVHHLFLV
jgi:hypothetical protein